jgi:asparagine synthase (glutamine-hydrolysing)
MCGILGQIQLSDKIDESIFTNMLLSLSHRGPDHAGIKLSENKQLAFGHTRLSFIDLRF